MQYLSIDINSTLNYSTFYNSLKKLRNKKLIISLPKHNKSAFHHIINTKNHLIINLKRSSSFLNQIITIKDVQLCKIKLNTPKVNCSLQIKKEKMNFITHVFNEITKQNYNILPAELTNLYNYSVSQYTIKIENLIKYITNLTSHSNNINIETPPVTPLMLRTPKLAKVSVIEDTPERTKIKVNKFYKRFLHSSVPIWL